MKHLTVLSITCALLCGCAGSARDDGFDDVHDFVQNRAHAHVHWNRGGVQDRQVAEQIRQILSRPMQADDAVQVALLNQPRLQAQYERLGVAQADLVAAGLLRNPVFDAEVRFPESGQGSTNLRRRQFPRSALSAGAKASGGGGVRTRQTRGRRRGAALCRRSAGGVL